MSEKTLTTYYCWVRLVKMRADAQKTKVNYFHGDPPDLLHHGSRPPGVVEGEALTARGDKVTTLIWSADPGYFGREDGKTVFEYGPAFASRQKAVDWLGTPAGAAWDVDALNRFLMAATPVERELPKPDCAPCGCDFPETDWNDEFRYKHCRPLADPLFNHDELSLKPLQHYIGGRDEQAELMRLAKLRRAQRKQIYAEAHGSVAAAYPVLRAAGWITDGWPSTPRMRAIKELRQLVLDSVELSVYKFKNERCRARPWTTYPTVKPMFRDPGHKCYPGHPAFPSGHATVAYVFALLIAKIDKDQDAGKLLRVAQEVAERREIAGVHFPSDTAAGKDLAEQMVEQLFSSKGGSGCGVFVKLVESIAVAAAA
jgi:PAP2 superfamily